MSVWRRTLTSLLHLGGAPLLVLRPRRSCGRGVLRCCGAAPTDSAIGSALLHASREIRALHSRLCTALPRYVPFAPRPLNVRLTVPTSAARRPPGPADVADIALPQLVAAAGYGGAMSSPNPLDVLDLTEPLPTRCVARSKRTGEQCGRRPVPGATVCHYHGGAAPQVRKKAERRLAVLVGDVLDLWHSILSDDTIPAAARVAVGKDVLDRLGITAPKDPVIHQHEMGGTIDIDLGPRILAALHETRQLAAEHQSRMLESATRREVADDEQGREHEPFRKPFRTTAAVADVDLGVIDAEVLDPAPTDPAGAQPLE